MVTVKLDGDGFLNLLIVSTRGWDTTGILVSIDSH